MTDRMAGLMSLASMGEICHCCVVLCVVQCDDALVVDLLLLVSFLLFLLFVSLLLLLVSSLSLSQHFFFFPLHLRVSLLAESCSKTTLPRTKTL